MATVAAHGRSASVEVLAVASSAILNPQLGLETVHRGVPKAFGVIIRAAGSRFGFRFLRRRRRTTRQNPKGNDPNPNLIFSRQNKYL